MSRELDKLSINAIRVLSADAIEKSKSGHPGLPLGSATMAFTLWTKMNHNGKNPEWDNRDRFVLSAGHGSMLEYSLLHLFGYGLTVEDLKNFRQVGSLTPGHPEYGHTKGVEITTGPLGQGICNAVGMAIAEAHLAEKFNKPEYSIVDHHTYAIVGDGCLMEGISGEASSLAGTLELGKLIVLYDSNNISIEGNTDIAFREDVAKRYEAYGWQVLKVADGNDIDAIEKAIAEAKAETKKPSMIIVKNQIGFGCPAKQGKASAHGEPLGADNVKAMKENLGWKAEPAFYVPDEVYTNMNEHIAKGEKTETAWNELFKAYSAAYPELASEYTKWMSGEIDKDALLNNEELWSFDKEMATRESSGIMINRLAKLIPNFIGGSADLAPSNKTHMNDRGDFSAEDRSGSNLHFGVREHAMAAIANGMYAHGGLKVFCATFFVFSDYMKGAMRLSALMKLPVTYVLTHDSIGVGEDGPTHEPIEHLAALRSMPNMTVFRPADSKETAAAWYYAVTNGTTPTSLVLTRQKLPLYDGCPKRALKGGYILKDSKKETPDLLLMASGSEVELIFKAADELSAKGIDARVISMPSFELFDAQDEAYKESVMPKAVRARLAVEALTSFGWHKYVGLDGDVISLDTFGASGKAEVLFEQFGFTVENVVGKAIKVVEK
ncbi:transketolase [Clostridium saccharoperbutylacetonicum]|uniref:Transketolase n=1 Tax=Clostridium saccharoperbutylacetonicum N1-4(HMT) TaxID=931276 RepID=M1MQH3_9CLOT|nr:transketolase [Clostridium saccharoperbutylacetonicum]AGF58438.1 transketolase Tkt [Clostridium saccharoperbutylacetonicum N1-4(HMT)]NRT60784.1 transketolase [Clostridium saccharoperbutylacetonicum]NSB24098.1 transketolase [Clostridium saccharoperbutylacetonicum]NSB43476.1 transketolase [Clostridium saccharoperbutylacetonicum]